MARNYTVLQTQNDVLHEAAVRLKHAASYVPHPIPYKDEELGRQLFDARMGKLVEELLERSTGADFDAAEALRLRQKVELIGGQLEEAMVIAQQAAARWDRLIEIKRKCEDAGVPLEWLKWFNSILAEASQEPSRGV